MIQTILILPFKVVAICLAFPFILVGTILTWYYRGIRHCLKSMFHKKWMRRFCILKWAAVVACFVYAQVNLTYAEVLALLQWPPFLILAALLIFYDLGHLIYVWVRSHAGRGTRQQRGYDYEYAVAKQLKRKGYRRVTVTVSSGDFGADIIACKGFYKYAIQCKCYSGTVGVKAVQEALAGKAYYNCDKAMVITNSTFTPAAVELASKSKVILWDHFKAGNLSWLDRLNQYIRG